MDLLKQLLEATLVTIKIFLVTGSLSIAIGLLISIAELNSTKGTKRLIRGYVLLMRGTPLLLQLIVVYFGFPYIGIYLSREVSVVFAFVLNYAAYFNEIFRGGFESIEAGQFEAAKVLGLSKRKMYTKIIIPQTIKRVLPSVSNEIITLVKDTSLVYVIGIGELLRSGKIAANRDATIMPLLLVGLIYLVLIGIITKLLNRWEGMYEYYE